MKKTTKIRDVLWYLLPVLLIALGSVVSKEIIVTKVEVNLSGSEGNRFLDEKQLLDDVESHLGYPLVGGKLIHKDLSVIEKRIKSNKFVYSAAVVSDHKGRVSIDIQQETPIARIISSEAGYYLTETGHKMPTSHNYTSRVMLVLGNKTNEILRTDSLADKVQRDTFVEMLKYIVQDEFLKAQIETIEILDTKKIVMYPQITHQKILFGTTDEYVDKFEKIKLFYSQILPRKGWKQYSTVSVEYKNQIICE